MSVKPYHRPGQQSVGPWGRHTSSMDWCEDNYTHNHYIAEFWNTVSNVPFILLGVFAMLSTRGLPNRNRYIVASSFLCIIGAGSFAFHATLFWNAQLLFDELPMVWSGAMFMYLASVGGAARGSKRLKVTLIALPVAISWLYLRYPYPILFQVSFGLTQVAVIIQVTALFRALKSVTPDELGLRRECKKIFIKGSLMFATGFLIWNIDNLACETLTKFRTDHPWIPGVFTQGHAWWHILAGVGVSQMACAVTWLSVTLGEPGQFEFGNIIGYSYVRRKGADPFSLEKGVK